MNTDAQTLMALMLQPWQADYYASLARPVTISGAARRVDTVASDLTGLRTADHSGAVRGATELLRVALLGLVAVDAPSLPALEKKARYLAAHPDLIEASHAAVIGAAIQIDIERLDLSLGEEARIRALLPDAAA